MTPQAEYASKKKTLADAQALIHSGDIIAVSGAITEPVVFLNHLQDIIPRLEGVTLIKSKDNDYAYLRDPETAGHVLTLGHFYHTNFREGHALGITSYLPSDLHNYMSLRTAYKPNNVFIAKVTDMDENGNFQVNLSQMWERDIDPLSCKKIILEVNKNLKTINGGVDINIKDVDAFYEAEYPIYEIQDAPSSEIDNVIGQYVAELVHDGDTIQLGIGSLPNACARNLMDKKDLGIHSEMFTNLMGTMVEKGVITGARKNLNPGKHIFCFAGGTNHLFDMLHEDSNCIIRPASYVTDPMVIRQNDNMVSINAIMEIDLTGQVCSESIGTRQYSGPGGAFDFAYGAAHSKGGRSILIMHSTTNKGESKIKPILTPGAVVTIPRPYVDIVVTEYGIAHMRGQTVQSRVKNLIAIAHPDVREELTREAKKLFYI